jgi:choline dehydrogenase-like flavoprotein
VTTRARGSRVLFDGHHASGVEYLNGDGQPRRVSARREVILSAGAYQSPQMLMLSGVGPAAHLQEHGIPVLHDLSGVGENLHDHIDYCAPFMSHSTELVGFSIVGLAHAMAEIGRYAFTGRGLLASNLGEAGGYLCTRPGLDAPDIQYHFITSLLEDHLRKLRWGHGFSIHTNVCRPKSRGSLRLRSGDPRAKPVIDLGFFQDPDDIECLLAGFKLIRRVVETTPLREYVLKDLCTDGIESDEEVKAVLREKAETGYHPVGSCRMGDDTGAVVDSRLRVNGLAGLRVVDASVMPAIPGANTNAPTIMIAEKASDMIRADANG